MADSSQVADPIFAQVAANPFSDSPPAPTLTHGVDVGTEGADPIFAQVAANPFSGDENQGEQKTSAFGSLFAHAALGAGPAATALTGAGVGAELGAAGGPVGAAIGGIVGGFAGAYAGGKAQDYAIKRLPANWRDPIEQTLQEEEQEHPYASFLGGLTPYALTMSPWGAAKALPANATALQRIMANPATARLFGGGLQGGIELAQEEVNKESPDWTKIAIATGFGIVFAHPNRFGEKVTEFGAGPTRALLGRESPTVNEAKAAGLLGTDEEITGQVKPNPVIEQSNQDAVRTENAVLGKEPDQTPDIHTAVDRSYPGLLAAYDALDTQRAALRTHLETVGNPSDATIASADRDVALLEGQIALRRMSAGDAKPLLDNLRDAQDRLSDLQGRRAAWERGEVSPEAAAIQKHIAAIDAQQNELWPQVAGAYLHMAPVAKAEVITPPVRESPIVPTEAAVTAGAPQPPEAAPTPAGKPLAEQMAFIADDVRKQALAAGWDDQTATDGGHIIANWVVNRAQRFGGALGTPEELYRREGAQLIPGQNAIPVPVAPDIAPILQKASKYLGIIRAMDKQGETPESISRTLVGLFGRKEAIKAKDIAAILAHDKELAQRGELNQISAYHGSPHDFDRFDIKKIGTGEGAQAYGHGIYFAERRGVAESYQQALTPQGVLVKKGFDYDPTELGVLNRAFNTTGEDAKRAIALLKDQAESARSRGHIPLADAIESARRNFEEGNYYAQTTKGALYTVSIDAKPEDFLDWDKPLSEQSPKVREAIQSALPKPKIGERLGFGMADIHRNLASESTSTGMVAYGQLGKLLGGGDHAATDALQKAGIKGIRYLDQGSRITGGVDKIGDKYFVKGSMTPYATRAEAEAASEAAGNVSHNFVIFNDSDIKITHKNGEPVKGDEAEDARKEIVEDNAEKRELFQQGPAPTYYSAVQRAVEGSKLTKGSPEQWLATLKNIPGIKPEEVKWLGLEDWLREQKGPVTREQVADYVRANHIDVQEVQRGDNAKAYDEMRPIEEALEERLQDSGLMHQLATGQIGVDDLPEDARELARQYLPLHEKWKIGWERKEPKFPTYVLPGGQNYRELLLTLPQKYRTADEIASQMFGKEMRFLDEDQREQVSERLAKTTPPASYQSSHWEEPNVLAHIRFDDRVGPNGEKILHVAEMQSDWAKLGRRVGFQEKVPPRYTIIDADRNQRGDFASEEEARAFIRTRQERGYGGAYEGATIREVPGVPTGAPPAPFVGGSWPELTVKRMIRYAAENGYDKLTWDTGKTNAARYPDELRKQISRIYWASAGGDGLRGVNAVPVGEGEHVRFVVDKNGVVVKAPKNDLVGKPIEDVFGKDMATKIMAEEKGNIESKDFMLGAKGFEDLYDKRIPQIVSKLTKKFGGKVEEGTTSVARHTAEDFPDWVAGELPDGSGRFGVFDQATGLRITDYSFDTKNDAKEWALAQDRREIPVHSLTITPELREAAVNEGFPMFQGGTQVKKASWTPGQVRNVIRRLQAGDASSFIHEYAGHEFFDRLMKDAEHELAPNDLKDDAFALVEALNKIRGRKTEVQLREAVPDWAHEQVARWAEQYFWEGRVPDKRLAGVFERFKIALRSIYQAVLTILDKGQKPIPDAFKQVWDKLLAEPQGIVVTPERMRGETLAGIHARDAEEAPHGEPAVPIMDRAEAEVELHTNELHPEVANVLTPVVERIEAENAATAKTEPATENRPGEGQEPSVPAGGVRPEPVPGGGGAGVGHQPELGGGGAIGGESPVFPAGSEFGPRPVSGDAAKSGPAPVTPAVLTREPRFVDKAANVRLDTLHDALASSTGGEENAEIIKQLIHEIADANNDFIGDRQGKITIQEQQQLAESGGFTLDWLMARRLGQAFNSIETWAARKMFVTTSTDMFNKAALAKQLGTDEAKAAYLISKNTFTEVFAQVTGITAEAGRALGAHRAMKADFALGNQIAKIAGMTGKTLFQIDEEIALVAGLDRASDVAAFTADNIRKRSGGARLLELFINNLISGLATHITYTLSNKMFAYARATLETPVASIIGAMRAQAGREGERVFLGEAGAQLRADWAAQATASKYALDSFIAGATTKLPGEKISQLTPFQPKGAASLGPQYHGEILAARDAVASVAAVFNSATDGIKAGYGLLRAGGVEGAPLWEAKYSPLGANPDYYVKGVNVAPLGSIIRGPSRLIAALHTYTRVNNYIMSISSQAYRQASMEGLDAAAFASRVQELMKNPTEAMMERAIAESTQAALMEQTGAVAKKLSEFVNVRMNLPVLGETQPFKFIDPFVHISSNILRQSLRDRTVLGLFSPEIRAQLKGEYGNVVADTAAAKMIVGSLLAIGFGSLAANGNAFGSGSPDPRMRALQWAAGYQPHSIRIGDMWYQVNRLGVMGALLSISADLYDVAHKADRGDMLAAGASLMHAFSSNILDESWMRGPASLIQAVEEPGRYGEGYIRNFFASFVPYSVGLAQMDRASDPFAREVRTMTDAIKAKIPGMSESLLPRRDIWGQPLPNKDSLIHAGITSIWEQRMGRDPVNQALINLGIAPAFLRRTIAGVELDDQQYDDYMRVAGTMRKANLNRIINSAAFHSWPGSVQHTVVKESLDQSKKAAEGWMKMKYPSIISQAYKQKKNKMYQEDAASVDIAE